ncbi:MULTISPECIES: VOC family protein [Leptolyngbya]|uniref:VOC family protein n=1 Tax=Leptolyngbya TaxID=47251 RepID=UPI0016855635|nr:VOC family protein [Leptolyngbya sp. FACHB-1624]MBD1856942.1 VOC family protein [Leptolyngbya sp. FACHB-1624]
MARLRRICPFIPAGEDVARTIAFYEQKLGFKRQWQDSETPELALISRDEIELFLQKNPDPECAEWTTLRIEVQDIADLYREIVECDRTLIHPNGKLEKKPWGSTDFTILDCNDVCITFYEF